MGVCDCPFHTPGDRTSRCRHARGRGRLEFADAWSGSSSAVGALKSPSSGADAKFVALRRWPAVERVPPTRGSRLRLLLIVAASLAVGLGYLLLAFRIIFDLRIGPTAVVLSSTHGIHTGDVLAFPVAALGVACLAFAVSFFERRRRSVPLAVPRRLPDVTRRPV